jgi:hypothetical protein
MEFHAMSPDATKKQPTTEISELQEFELEYQTHISAVRNLLPPPGFGSTDLPLTLVGIAL